MGNRAALLLLLLVLCYGVTMAMGSHREAEQEEDWRKESEKEREREKTRGGEEWFLLQDSKHVVRTDAGDVRVVRSSGGSIIEMPIHVGFITMEPKTLFIPQYLDSSLILFLRRGEAKIGLIHKDELAERQLKMGDVYRIPAGSSFYLVNTGEKQGLHIICSIDPSESLGFGAFQSFFLGGGTYPTSILAGFGPETLSTAFNVTKKELKEIMTKQKEGPIVYVGGPHAPKPSKWTKFLQMKEQDRLLHLKRMVEFQHEPIEEEEQVWSWRKFLNSVFGQENNKWDERTGKSPHSHNIYDRRPAFKNNYGWTKTLDESDYHPLKRTGVGVYLVNLTAGSMMAPHVNPKATEYGVVLRGSGTIQIVYPNGTLAMNAKVKQGDVFWVPRYFPFCQIACRKGPFEFFGFTVSDRKNRPQFLAGTNSILQTLRGPELATAFGVNEDLFRRFIDAQHEAVILPSASARPPKKMKEKDKLERIPKVIKSSGNKLMMDFE